MATRVKMLKLLQEMSGITSFANRRPQTRTPGALVLPMNGFKSRISPRRQVIRISIQDPPDIPNPVKIIFLPAVGAEPTASQGTAANSAGTVS
jgi:hypothetical protein